MHLAYLKIHHYRSVKPGTELKFGVGMNVVLGRNGSGKTTLLELIAQLIRLDFRNLAKDRVSLEFRMEMRDDSVEVRLDIKPASPSEARSYPRRSVDTAEWEAELLVRFAGHSRQVLLTHSESKWRDPVDENWSPIDRHIGLERLGDQVFFALMTTVQPAHNFAENPLFRRMMIRLDEGLKYFELLTEQGGPGVMVTGLDPPSSEPLVFDRVLVPSSLFRGSRTLRSAEKVTEISDDNPFLKGFSKVAGFKRVQLDMPFQREDRSVGFTVRTFEGVSLTLTLPNGDRFTHRDMSFGQKRLFSFLYYAALQDKGGILAVDELVNGLHHEWIEACLDCIGDRQAFLTSQNPLLLDHLGFDDANEAQRSFVRCEIDDAHRWVWRQLTDHEAGAFFRAVKVGYQHVSEILRDQGLW